MRFRALLLKLTWIVAILFACLDIWLYKLWYTVGPSIKYLDDAKATGQPVRPAASQIVSGSLLSTSDVGRSEIGLSSVALENQERKIEMSGLVDSETEYKKFQETIRHGRISQDIDVKYMALFANLSAVPGTAQQLRDKLIDRRKAAQDAFDDAIAQGLTRHDALRQVKESVGQKFENEIREMLPLAQYSQYAEYEATIGARITTSILAESESAFGTPLDAAQVERLVYLFASTESSKQRESEQDFNLIGRQIMPITDGMVSLATSLLNNEQLNNVKLVQRQIVREQEIRRMFNANPKH